MDKNELRGQLYYDMYMDRLVKNNKNKSKYRKVGELPGIRHFYFEYTALILAVLATFLYKWSPFMTGLLAIPVFAYVLYAPYAMIVERTQNWNIVAFVCNLYGVAFGVLGLMIWFFFPLEAAGLWTMTMGFYGFYYLALPFADAKKIFSIKFLILALYGVGFSAFIIGAYCQVKMWDYGSTFLVVAAFLMTISCGILLLQFAANPKKNATHLYYASRMFYVLLTWYYFYTF